MGSPRESGPFLFIIILVVLSLLLVVAGFAMRRRGKLATPRAALGWAVLCILPLFGALAALTTSHLVQQATGETQSGRNNYASDGPPR